MGHPLHAECRTLVTAVLTPPGPVFTGEKLELSEVKAFTYDHTVPSNGAQSLHEVMASPVFHSVLQHRDFQ